ncbi:MAG: hypothetical protein GY869_30755 [Planctomycetes bacterium]|nr:hypothetical protein [Planctomycetota bacterium]
MCTELQKTKTNAAQNNQSQQFPDLLTEAELILFLRIPQVSKAKNYHHAVEHLRRFRGLPCIQICGQPLYPRQAIQEWIGNQTTKGK